MNPKTNLKPAGKPSNRGDGLVIVLGWIAITLLLCGIACLFFSDSLGGGLFWSGIGVLGLALFSVPSCESPVVPAREEK